MRTIFITLALVGAVLWVYSSYAVPEGSKTMSSAGGFRLVPANATGPALIEARADGTATIQLVSSSRSRTWPGAPTGDSSFPLKDAEPRPFYTRGDKVDSVLVTFGTASEVILTWTNE